jgi:hypothetical protein
MFDKFGIDVHAVPHPFVSSEQASYLEIHGTPAQLDLVLQVIRHVAHSVVAVRDIEPCPEPNADGCHRLDVVTTGWVDPAEVGAIYQAAVATHN